MDLTKLTDRELCNLAAALRDRHRTMSHRSNSPWKHIAAEAAEDSTACLKLFGIVSAHFRERQQQRDEAIRAAIFAEDTP